MASIDRRALAAYRQTLDMVCAGAGSAVTDALGEWLAANPGASIAEIREAAIALTDAVLGTYGDAASTLACDLFDSIMELEGVGLHAAQVYGGVREDAVEGTVRRIVGDVDDTQESRDAFMKAVGKLAERETRLAANTTIEENVERAAKTRAGRNVRYARVPTRAVPCEWCAMLASRGFVYRSAEKAEAASHHHCTCTIVPGIKGVTQVAGYDPKHYADVWHHRERYENATIFNRDLSEGHSDRIPAPETILHEVVDKIESYGYPVHLGDEEALGILGLSDADAVTLSFVDEQGAFDGCSVYFREKPTVSELLEELFHVEQARRGDYMDAANGIFEMRDLREIDAQRYLLSVANEYNIPKDETRQTKRALNRYLADLDRLRGWGFEDH